MQKNSKKIIILGSGPAGYTATIYAARANLNPVIITGNEQGGQLTSTTLIENWPGESSKITGIELMQKMLKHVQQLITKNNIINDNINKVIFNKKPFKLIGDKNEYKCDSLIIATGASPKYLNIESEKKYIGLGVSVCATCDGFFYKNKKVAVIGGGNTAIEESIYLSNIASEVHIVHRNNIFKADAILIKRMEKKIKNKKIFLHKNYLVHKILGDNNGVTGLQLKSNSTREIKKLLISGIFIAIGRIPNTDIFSNQLKLNNGYINIIKNNDNSTQTSVKGIFAAGDVIDPIYKQAITAAASGCMAAIDAKKYLEKLQDGNI